MTLSLQLTHSIADFQLEASFDAPAGVTALFGRSGSGKTTLVNLVAGLLRPTRAKITLAGRVLEDSAQGIRLPPHKRGIGYVFQDTRLFPHLSVRANLTYAQRFLPRAKIDAGDLPRIITLLGLEALLDRRPGTLSGGEAQRVAIGRALLSNPRLLIMDEPLAALDGARRDDILPFLETLCQEVQIPVLYISHSISEVARLARQMVVIEAGKVLRAGPTAEVMADLSLSHVFSPQDLGAVLTARVEGHDSDGLSELRVSGGRLYVPRLTAPKGAELRLRIAALDVILARTRPSGLSALNILPAKVEGIGAVQGASHLVQLRIGEDLILARITARSAKALGIVTGVSCFAVIKSVAVAQASLG